MGYQWPSVGFRGNLRLAGIGLGLTSSYTDRPAYDGGRHPHHKSNFNPLRFVKICRNTVNSNLRMHLDLIRSLAVTRQANGNRRMCCLG